MTNQNRFTALWSLKAISFSRWWLLIPILVVATFIRLPYMHGFGHEDLATDVAYAQTLRHTNLFGYYTQYAPTNIRTYPPLATATYGAAATLYALMKPYGPG